MWLTIAWSWLKKYWMWLLFPIGILIFILGKISVCKSPDVVAPELVGAEEERRKAQEGADRQVFIATKEREKKLDEIRKEHEQVIKDLTDEQRGQVKELEEDPDKLNDFLLDVGRQIRG